MNRVSDKIKILRECCLCVNFRAKNNELTCDIIRYIEYLTILLILHKKNCIKIFKSLIIFKYVLIIGNQEVYKENLHYFLISINSQLDVLT